MPSGTAADDETTAAVEGASQASKQVAEPSKLQKKLDKLEDRVLNITDSEYSSAGKQFYSDNVNLFKSSAEAIAGTSDWNTIEENINGFAESSKVLISLLDEVAKIHPFVGIAVLAFKGVITLELKRRDNDRKVIALKLQMQEMMAVLLQLRNIKGSSQSASDGILLKNRMGALMKDIAKDIESCGNVCDAYSKKHILVKVLKGPIYANRLADFASVFKDRQKEIRMALLLHTATSLDSVMDRLTDVDQGVKSTGEKLDMMTLFRKLDSLEEKELMKQVQARGGPLKCMEDDSALAELISVRKLMEPERPGPGKDHFASDGPQERLFSKSGYNNMPQSYPIHPRHQSHAYQTEMAPGHSHRIPSQPLNRPLPRRSSNYYRVDQNRHPTNILYNPEFVKESEFPIPVPQYGGPSPDESSSSDGDLAVLKKELHEDVDKSFEKNMIIFQRKMDVQRRQLAAAISDVVIRQGDRVINAMSSGPHERIIDMDLRNIWEEMGWKGSVKARDFVFALHEHFVEEIQKTDPLQAFITSAASQTSEAFQIARKIANKKANDLQVLQYLNMRNIQPILEAFDDDGSGFVTIREVNQFAATKPRHWSLQQWISYWAVGWHFIVWEYETKIYGIVSDIFRGRGDLLPPNRSLVDEYLNNPALDTLTDLLGALRPFESKLDDNFRSKVLKYADEEETRIESNLQLMAYEIDAPSTLMLVTGPGRIERYIFPLLFLILRHHLRIIKIASRALIDREELKTAARTVQQVFSIVLERVEVLDAIFRQKYVSVDPGITPLSRFAFSMFSNFIDPDTVIRPPDDLYMGGSYEDNLRDDQLDASILKYPPLEGLDRAAYENYASTKTMTSPTGSSSLLSIDGTWSGFCAPNNATDSTCGLIQITIATNTEYGSFVGSGVDVMGSFDVSGKYLQDHTFEAIFTHDRHPDHSDSIVPAYIIGKRNLASRVISGEWGTKKETIIGTMTLHPIPASLYRFRPEVGVNLNIARSRWKSAGAAVLDEVRQRLWSWRFFRARFTTRKHYTELYRRRYLSDVMNDKDRNALMTYERNLLPADIRFYRSIARSYYGDCIHFNVTCSSCNGRIIGSRFLCFSMPGPYYGDLSDYCLACFRSLPSLRPPEFSDVIQSTRAVHPREMETLKSSAWQALNNTLDIVREGGSCTCNSCHESISGDYWACVYCREPEILICGKCNIGNRKTGDTGTAHTDAHPLIRVLSEVGDNFPSWGAINERIKSPKPPVQKLLSFFERIFVCGTSSSSSGYGRTRYGYGRTSFGPPIAIPLNRREDRSSL